MAINGKRCIRNVENAFGSKPSISFSANDVLSRFLVRLDHKTTKFAHDYSFVQDTNAKHSLVVYEIASVYNLSQPLTQALNTPVLYLQT